MRITQPVPARTTAGITPLVQECGRVVEEMKVLPALVDEQGTLTTGALGILADSALGHAVASALDEDTWVATSHLHLAVLRPLARHHDRYVIVARVDAVGDGRAAAHAEITAPDGTCVARASLGSVLLPAAALGVERTDGPTAAAEYDERAAPVDELLGLHVGAVVGDASEATFRADPALAKSSGGVHGGVGFLVGARLLDVVAAMRNPALRVADAAPGAPPARPAGTDPRPRRPASGRRRRDARRSLRGDGDEWRCSTAGS